MGRPKKLDNDGIRERLNGLPGWELRNGKLHREFRFADFASAFAFMTAAALHAEKLDHHPDWSNVYNRVVVDLVTHDAEGVTSLDIELAGTMSRLAGVASG